MVYYGLLRTNFFFPICLVCNRTLGLYCRVLSCTVQAHVGDDVAIAPRDRQDGSACLHSAPKEPQAKVGVGEAGPLLVCTCQSGNCRRDPTVSTQPMLDLSTWIGMLIKCNQSGSGSPASIQSVIHGFIKSACQPSQRLPAHDEPCPAQPLRYHPTTPEPPPNPDS